MAVWLAIVAVFINFVLIFWIPSGPLNTYLAQPLLWGSVGVLALWARRQDGGSIRPSADRWLIGTAALIGLLQVVLLFLAGFLSASFGHSPYARQPLYIALNLWFVTARLAGIELARWQLVTALGRQHALVGGAAVWLLLTLAGLPLRGLVNPPTGSGALDLFGGVVAPVVGQSLLATYLAATAGPLASMAYLGILQLFEWVPAVLPKLPWTLALFLGVAVPMIGLMVARDVREWRVPTIAKGDGEAAREVTSGVGTLWVVVVALSVFLIWFNTGLFGVRPALVAGQSMEPTLYLGDLAVTRKVQVDDVKVGDIVWYQRGSLAVIHRVVSIRNQGGQTVFITKGDNNNVEDPPVQASQIDGKMVGFIPKVGWISVGVKTLLGMVH